MYLSYENQSNNYVEFDDFKVTHTRTNILQYNEYYPFGLQTPNSWTREDASNRYLYNGGNELNENSGWYETFFRGYDPALGRFMQVDPLAGSFASSSPYHFANNNPLLFNDVMGDSTGTGTNAHSGPRYDIYSFPHPYNGHTWISPGSGNHWSDGATQYSDWSANSGSDSFRQAQATGAQYLGGRQYTYNHLGDLQPIVEKNGLLYVRCYACGEYAGSSRDGSIQYYYNTYETFQQQEDGSFHYEFEVLHSAKDSFSWDWFIETTSHGNLRYTQTAVIIFYNVTDVGTAKYGQVIGMIKRSRFLYNNALGRQAKDVTYKPSLNMLSWIDAAIDYHDFSREGAGEKFWNFIVTPGKSQYPNPFDPYPEPTHNRLEVVTGDHR